MVHKRRTRTSCRPIAASVFLLYTSCLRQKWNEAPGVRLFAPAFPRSTYKLFYELVISQSTAHFFIISLIWMRSRVAFMSDAFRLEDARRHATPLLFRNPRGARFPSRVSTLETMETTFLRLRITIRHARFSRNQNCTHRWREGLPRKLSI